LRHDAKSQNQNEPIQQISERGWQIEQVHSVINSECKHHYPLKGRLWTPHQWNASTLRTTCSEWPLVMMVMADLEGGEQPRPDRVSQARMALAMNSCQLSGRMC
jgi:hypothetical protein